MAGTARSLSRILLGDRLTVGHHPLEVVILVRIQVPEPNAGEAGILVPPDRDPGQVPESKNILLPQRTPFQGTLG